MRLQLNKIFPRNIWVLKCQGEFALTFLCLLYSTVIETNNISIDNIYNFCIATLFLNLFIMKIFTFTQEI